MAGLKEIRIRLRSVRNTRKITYAMKLVSAAKLRKAQDAVTQSREYRQALNDLLQQLSSDEVSHPMLEKRPDVKKIGLLVIGASRGLCGGYNSNLVRKAVSFFETKERAGMDVTAFLVGKKPAEYFRRVNKKFQTAYEDLADDVAKWPLDQIATEVETTFLSGQVDEVHMIYTKFRSALSMSVVCEQILPLDANTLAQNISQSSHESELAQNTSTDTSTKGALTIFEPSPEEVFAAILPRVLRSNIQQASLDAKASEYGSRMTAMDSATKNAGEISQTLQLKYNKLRQLGITSQLLDIVGGAEALN